MFVCVKAWVDNSISTINGQYNFIIILLYSLRFIINKCNITVLYYIYCVYYYNVFITT